MEFKLLDLEYKQPLKSYSLLLRYENSLRTKNDASMATAYIGPNGIRFTSICFMVVL